MKMSKLSNAVDDVRREEMYSKMGFKKTEIGIIPTEWVVKTVQELVVLNIIEKPMDGNHGSIHPKNSDYVDNGIPFIMASDLKDGKIDTINCKFIRKEQADNLQKGFAKTDDVLLTHKATIGRTGVIGKINTDYIMLTPQVTYYRINNLNKLNNYFLKYYFDSQGFQSLFNSWAGSGSTRSYLGITDQRKLPIIIPHIEEQYAIASILGSLDGKIELNHQMNTTLEAIGQAIFKHWFVDFEFPNEEGKPYKSSGGEMEETELGEVPLGWNVEEIGNIVKVVGGGTPSTKNPAFWDGGMHCWTTPKDLSGISSPVILDTAKKVTDAGLAKISSGLLPKGTFLLSSRAPVGYTAIAQVPIAVNQGYIAIPPSEQLSTLFLLYWTRENLETIEGRACGTTFQEISKKNFKPIRLTMPLPKILVKFDKTVGYLFERIVVNERESRTLTNIRDALLPKLMSGEIRVK